MTNYKCPVTGLENCRSRDCELHYMDAPLKLKPTKTSTPAKGKTVGVVAALTFVAAAALANYLTGHFGMVQLPLGGMVTAGTFMAGAVLIVRDAVNDLLGRLAVLCCIVAGAALSGLTSPTFIALASGVAFMVAELIDWAVYEPMRRRGWARAVLLSSIAATPVDTVVFLWIAPFPLTASAVAGQVAVKLTLTLVVVLIGKGAQRVVLRHRIEQSNA